MRIYSLTAITAVPSGSELIVDAGSGNAVNKVTYANLCLNQPAISTTGSITGATGNFTQATAGALTASTATLGDVSVTGNFSSRPYGAFYISTSGTATLASSAYALPAVTSTACPVNDVTASTAGRLTYDGATTRDFYVSAALSLQGYAVNDNDYTLAIYKGGTGAVAGLTVERTISGTDKASVGIVGIVSLAQSEYLEVWAKNTTDDDNLDFLGGQLAIQALN